MSLVTELSVLSPRLAALRLRGGRCTIRVCASLCSPTVSINDRACQEIEHCLLPRPFIVNTCTHRFPEWQPSAGGQQLAAAPNGGQQVAVPPTNVNTPPNINVDVIVTSSAVPGAPTNIQVFIQQ